MSNNNSHGGARRGAGRPRIYRPSSSPQRLTPESDLDIYLAEMDKGGRRGIRIGGTWYGYAEALAMAEFVEKHRGWLSESPE